MKKEKKTLSNRSKNFDLPKMPASREKSFDSMKLTEDLPEEFRDTSNQLETIEKPNMTNWSQAEDRSEDLINERDPFTQQPDRDSQIPPELIQERAYRLYEQRGQNFDDDLANWFDAERQLSQEIGKQQS